MVRLTDRPDMTLDVYRGRKTTMQQQLFNHITKILYIVFMSTHCGCHCVVITSLAVKVKVGNTQKNVNNGKKNLVNGSSLRKKC